MAVVVRAAAGTDVTMLDGLGATMADSLIMLFGLAAILIPLLGALGAVAADVAAACLAARENVISSTGWERTQISVTNIYLHCYLGHRPSFSSRSA